MSGTELVRERVVGRASEVIAKAFTSPGEVGRVPDRWGFALTQFWRSLWLPYWEETEGQDRRGSLVGRL